MKNEQNDVSMIQKKFLVSFVNNLVNEFKFV